MSTRLGTSLRRLLEDVGLLPTVEERLLDGLDRDLEAGHAKPFSGHREEPLRAEFRGELATLLRRRFAAGELFSDELADDIVAMVQREMFALLAEAGQDVDPDGPAADLVGWLADAIKAMDGGASHG